MTIKVVKHQVSHEQRIGLSVCAGEWHRLSVKLSENTVHVQVNDQRTRIPLKLGQLALNELRNQPVQLGSSTGWFRFGSVALNGSNFSTSPCFFECHFI